MIRVVGAGAAGDAEGKACRTDDTIDGGDDPATELRYRDEAGYNIDVGCGGAEDVVPGTGGLTCPEGVAEEFGMTFGTAVYGVTVEITVADNREGNVGTIGVDAGVT